MYVRPFPDVNARQWQISSNGGGGPIWARSGRELFYVAGDGYMMSVTVMADSEFVPSVPVRLFDTSSYYFATGPGGTYDISPDGRRFLMVKNVVSTADRQTRLTVATNWVAEMEERLRTAK